MDQLSLVSGFQIDYFVLNIFSQIFVDTTRNGENYNKETLLIISGIDSLRAFISPDQFKIPKDPYNKLAVATHFFYPTQFSDILGFNTFGNEDDFSDLINTLQNLKNFYIEKGIPIIFSEIGVNREYEKDIISIRLYLYSVFSLSIEYGIVPIYGTLQIKIMVIRIIIIEKLINGMMKK